MELQLGRTDETHVIRTVEYWDIERKYYPQYDHCAVIVAEDITSRFLNVTHLFNGVIPLIAIQMSAYKYEDSIGLIFTRVLDEMPLGLIEEDETEGEKQHATRDYWINKGYSGTIKVADKLLERFNELEHGHDLNFKKSAISVCKKGIPVPYFFLRPLKKRPHQIST